MTNENCIAALTWLEGSWQAADNRSEAARAVKCIREQTAEIARLRNIVTGCPVCSELERNIQPSNERSDLDDALTNLREVAHGNLDFVTVGKEGATAIRREIERLQKREKDLMDVIDSRDRALGFVPLDESARLRTGEAVVTNEQLMQRLRGKRVDGYPDKATMQFAADEIERLQKALRRANAALVRHGVQTDPAMNTLPSNEPLEQHPSALADHINAMCGWAETLAKAHGWRRENAGSFWSSYDAARAVANLQLGASRDASPADLVGALQDVVHTDPGPVRAAHAVRDASSRPALIMDWPNKCCSKCRKPLVYESQPAHYSGWRLDCICWDRPRDASSGESGE